MGVKPELKTHWSNKVFYGNTKEVTPVQYNAYNESSKNSTIKQDMEGFQKRYCDFPDYIMRITHEIWEEKGVGVIYETYSDSVQIRVSTLNSSGLNGVIAGTLETMHSFPDRRLIGEDVIWSYNPDETYYSSHRIRSLMTNLDDSSFGPATGKIISIGTVADCKVYKNKVVEEWLVRDNLSAVQQLGFDPIEVAKKMAIATKLKTPALQSHFGLSESRKGQFIPKVTINALNDEHGKFDIGNFITSFYENVWNSKYFNKIKDYYKPNAIVHSICNKELVGEFQIQGFLVSLFSCIPNGRVLVERVTCNEIPNEADSWNVAVRWRISGLHEGIGFFGQPTGKYLEILGINHYKVKNQKIAEEWVMFDGMDVLRQIYTETDSSEKTI